MVESVLDLMHCQQQSVSTTLEYVSCLEICFVIPVFGSAYRAGYELRGVLWLINIIIYYHTQQLAVVCSRK